MKVIVIFACVVLPFGVCDWPCIFLKPCVCDYYAKIVDCSNKGLNEIPPIVDNLPGAWQISLDRNNIKSIPDTAFSTITVATLDISNNQISNFSDTAFSTETLSVMQVLHMEANNITEIPSVVGHFTNLQELYLHGNPIPDYNPEIFKNIAGQLQTIAIGSIAMQGWPTAIQYLDQLTKIFVYDFPFNSLPESAFDAHKTMLYSITISSTKLKYLPQSLSNITNLKEFNLDGNQQLTADGMTPSSLKGLDLREITLSNCRLTRFPHILDDLSGLAFFNVKSADIVVWDANTIPPEVASKLDIMTLDNTSLRQVPAALSKLKVLQSLWFTNGNIESIGETDFANMSKLYNLYLTGNPISYISDEAFRDLPALEKLNLDKTLLTTVPKAVQNIKQLGSVDLSYTSIDCTCSNLGWMKQWSNRQNVHFYGTCRNIHMILDDFVKLETPKC